MTARMKISLGVLVIALLSLGVLLPDRTKESREATLSTYGKTPEGYGAVFDLLRELDFPVGRNLAVSTRIAAPQTIWWLASSSLCKRIGPTRNGVTEDHAPMERNEAPDASNDAEEDATQKTIPETDSPKEDSPGLSPGADPDAEPAPSVPNPKSNLPPSLPGSDLGDLAWLASAQESGDAKEDETSESVENGSDAENEWAGRKWIEQGGTALVFLDSVSEQGSASECARIGGFALPRRRASAWQRREARALLRDQHETVSNRATTNRISSLPALASVASLSLVQVDLPASEKSLVPTRTEKKRDADASMLDTVAQHFESDLSPKPRELETQGLLVFEDALDWQVRGTLDRQPFLLERTVGAGRLIVIADAAFLRNAWLDSADAAPLAVDLARAYGAPLFDEYEHGFRVEYNALHYLLRSRALPLFVGLALLGLLYAWHGSAYPRRSVSEIDVGVPTLETFVDSVATLSSRTHDFERVFASYRELTLDRIRRHCGLAPSASLRDVKERLERDARISRKMLRGLVDPPAVRSAGELRAAVQMLDLLFDEVRR